MNAVSLISHHYNDTAIEQRQADSYLNATAMCQANGKRINNYLRQQATQDFISALEAETRISASDLLQVRKGGSEAQGTWVHPLVAVNLAQWLSPQFAVWCSKIIYTKVLENARLSPEQQRKLRRLVENRVHDISQETGLGGQALYPAIWRCVHDACGVSKLDQIPAGKVDIALEAIYGWQPPKHLSASTKLPAPRNAEVLGLAANNRVLELERQRGMAIPNFHVLLFAALHSHFEVATLADIAQQDMPEAIRFIQAYDPSLPAVTDNQMPFSQEQLKFLAKMFKRANQDVADPTTRAGQTGRFGLALQWTVEDLTEI